MNDIIYVIVGMYVTQLTLVGTSVITLGLLNDPDMNMSKKTLLLWLLPYVMIVYYIFKGFITGVRKLN